MMIFTIYYYIIMYHTSADARLVQCNALTDLEIRNKQFQFRRLHFECGDGLFIDTKLASK